MKALLVTLLVFVALSSGTLPNSNEENKPEVKSIDFASFYPYKPSLEGYYPTESTPTQNWVPLRQVADKTHVYVGAVRNYYDNQQDRPYVSTLNSNYNLNTAENACKWAATEPNQGQFDFTQCDYVANATYAAQAIFRGHNLCWGAGNPGWLTNGRWNEQQLRSILTNHVTTVVSKYRGAQFFCWDVVNEAVSDNGPGLKNNVWYPAVSNYIDVAFSTARASDSRVQLFYNDYGGEGMNQKSNEIYNLVSGMKSRGVPIDGVGLQMHVSTNYYPSPQDVSANIKRLGGLGLNVHITEMDVRCENGCGPSEQQTQANIYSAMTKVCLENDNCKSFETWGFTDKYSWLGVDAHGLPFDQNFNPKQAAFAIEAAFRG